MINQQNYTCRGASNTHSYLITPRSYSAEQKVIYY